MVFRDRGVPGGAKNRQKIDQESLQETIGGQTSTKDVPKATKERPRAPQERPKRPQGAPKRPQEGKKIVDPMAMGALSEAPGPAKD